MTNRLLSVRLRASQWERLLDLAFVGAKMVRRFTNEDTPEVLADIRAYEALKLQLVNADVIQDDVLSVTVTASLPHHEGDHP